VTDGAGGNDDELACEEWILDCKAKWSGFGWRNEFGSLTRDWVMHIEKICLWL